MSLPFILLDLPDILLEVTLIVSSAMMKKDIKKVHGHTLNELSDLLMQSTELFDSGVTLNPISLGGWSNINIQGSHEGTQFVLKLPWSTQKLEKNHYAHLFNIALFTSKSKICARPLDFGTLFDSKRTPFIILEYIDGTVYDVLSELTPVEKQSLNNSLTILSDLQPPDIPRFNSPSDYLDTIRKSVKEHEWLTRDYMETNQIRELFYELLPELFLNMNDYGEWSMKTMHSDLWVPNIVFDKGRAVFLDIEDCAQGDPLYDIAYLLEASYSGEVMSPTGLVHPDDLKRVEQLRPLALASVIGWSITRLLSMDAGLVEASISNPRIRNEVLNYARMKLIRLERILS